MSLCIHRVHSWCFLIRRSFRSSGAWDRVQPASHDFHIDARFLRRLAFSYPALFLSRAASRGPNLGCVRDLLVWGNTVSSSAIHVPGSGLGVCCAEARRPGLKVTLVVASGVDPMLFCVILKVCPAPSPPCVGRGLSPNNSSSCGAFSGASGSYAIEVLVALPYAPQARRPQHHTIETWIPAHVLANAVWRWAIFK